MKRNSLKDRILKSMSNVSHGGDTYFWDIEELVIETGSKPQAIRRCIQPMIDSGEIVSEKYKCELFDGPISGVKHYILKDNIEKQNTIMNDSERDEQADRKEAEKIGISFVEYQIRSIFTERDNDR